MVRHDVDGHPFYYNFSSTANCCQGPNTGYSVIVNRSTSPTGTFVDQNSFRPGGSGNPPVDYKLMVFHGKVHFTQVNRDRFNALKVTYYDRSWQRVEVVGRTDDGARTVAQQPPVAHRLTR